MIVRIRRRSGRIDGHGGGLVKLGAGQGGGESQGEAKEGKLAIHGGVELAAEINPAPRVNSECNRRNGPRAPAIPSALSETRLIDARLDERTAGEGWSAGPDPGRCEKRRGRWRDHREAIAELQALGLGTVPHLHFFH